MNGYKHLVKKVKVWEYACILLIEHAYFVECTKLAYWDVVSLLAVSQGLK